MLRCLFATRTSPKSWLAAVEDDFAWFGVVSREFLDYCTPAAWFQAFKARPKQMRRLIKNVCATPAANILTTLAKTPALAAIGMDWPCHACGKILRSKGALRTHQFDLHGYVRQSRAYVGRDANCGFCQLQFSCRTACIVHLEEKSPVCKHFLLLAQEPIDDVTLQEIEAEDSLLRVKGVKPTVVRLEGPVPYLDEEELPIAVSMFWDQTSRHPLGKNRKWHSPVDVPIGRDGCSWETSCLDDESCPASFFAQCGDDCVLCRGCTNEDWILTMPLQIC